MLIDQVGNIENTSDEQDSDVTSSLECQKIILAAEAKILSLKLENLDKAMNIDR